MCRVPGWWSLGLAMSLSSGKIGCAASAHKRVDPRFTWTTWTPSWRQGARGTGPGASGEGRGGMCGESSDFTPVSQEGACGAEA